VLPVTRHGEHAASLIVSMAGTVILWLCCSVMESVYRFRTEGIGDKIPVGLGSSVWGRISRGICDGN
jgi:hypothetical protein